MPRFAANLSMLFGEVAFLDRFERAARAGFKAVECLFPYDYPAAEIAERLEANRLQLVLHNFPPGAWDAGDRGLACHPTRRDEFRDSVAHAIEYARALRVPQLHCMAGIRPAGASEALLRATYVANLQYAAAELSRVGLRLLIEPINPYDMPGFYLNRTDQAIAILDQVGADNVFVQYDIYHAQRVHGELATTIEKHLHRIGHMQIADNPGRHEPGSGEINFAFLFDHIDRLGYAGWIGCEYRPQGSTEAGLGWRERLC